MRISFLLFFFSLIATVTFGQGIIDIRDLIQGKEVGTQTSLFRDDTRNLNIEDVQSNHFEINDTDVINIGFTNDACWLKLEIVNTTPETQKVFLRSGKLLADTVELFHNAGTGWNSMLIGVNVPNSLKLVKGRSSYFPMKFEPGDTTTIFLRTVSTYGIQYSISILDEEELREKDTHESLIQGFYLGALLIITFYNLFIGFSIRDSVYLHYALANLATIMAALSIRGFFSYYAPDNYVDWTSYVVTGTTALYAIMSCNFSIRILNLRKYSRPAYYLLLLVAGISLLFAVGLSIMRLNGYIIHNELLAYSNILFTIAAIYAGVVAYRNGSYYAKYYLMGWTLLLLSVLLYTLVISGYIERNDFTANLYLIGSVLEIVLLSFALADRYNYLLAERNALKTDLKNKQGDLAMVISDNRMRHQVKRNILEEVESINRSDPDSRQSKLNSFIQDLRLQLDTEEKLDYLQDNIQNINTEFVNQLKKQFPQLSQSELEICTLIKLNLSIKEISRIRKVSEGAIKVSRHRIKKKLNLESVDQLETTIQDL